MPILPNAVERIKNKKNIHRNLSYAELFEHEMRDSQVSLTDLGAINVDTKYTGRSPKDKYFVTTTDSKDDIAFGEVNKPIDKATFDKLNDLVIAHFESKEIYIFDGFLGVGKFRKKVRVITEYAFQCHFMTNMLIRPTKEELEDFNPDFRLYNGCGVANPDFHIDGLNSEVFIVFNTQENIAIIGGTSYTGEMKKGLFTMMNYWLPKQQVLPMHCSANIASDGNTALFFGLSGTGKTTLSSDESRELIGDDEHGWDDEGVFNIEGGCYAKCIHLDAEKEPLIYNAIKRDALLENVHLNDGVVDFDNSSKSQNTRVSYPIYHIDNYRKDLRGNHPKHIIFLSYDAFGILPAVSRLTKEQAMYYFLSGYTAKVAGTEQGVEEPTATFSACFGEAFLPMSPNVYAQLLGQKIEQHQTKVYLINTGLIGGAYGDANARRIGIKETRACLHSILSDGIEKSDFERFGTFDLQIPTTIDGVDSVILNPRNLWSDKAQYDKQREALANRFIENFDRYKDGDSSFYQLSQYGPKV